MPIEVKFLGKFIDLNEEQLLKICSPIDFKSLEFNKSTLVNNGQLVKQQSPIVFKLLENFTEANDSQ